MNRLKTIAMAAAFVGTAGLAQETWGQEWQPLPEQPPVPVDNPMTAEKVELGKMLYFDPRLSRDGTVSCFSCHNVMEGGDDNRPVSAGVHGQEGGRNAPTVWNSAFLSVQFWDGRAASLEEQAKGPFTNPIEMGMADGNAVAERIRVIPGYRSYFERAFGEGAELNLENAARAIAAYERTLITPNSPYDRFLAGDEDALTPVQQAGMKRFAEVGCTSCHQGPLLAGPALPEGQGFFMKFPTVPDHPYVAKYGLTEDAGRREVTGEASHRFLWRVPMLRNVALTAPYFHNGAVRDLAEAVRVMAATQLRLELDEQEVREITSFLEALTGEFPEQTMPRLPGSGAVIGP